MSSSWLTKRDVSGTRSSHLKAGFFASCRCLSAHSQIVEIGKRRWEFQPHRAGHCHPECHHLRFHQLFPLAARHSVMQGSDLPDGYQHGYQCAPQIGDRCRARLECWCSPANVGSSPHRLPAEVLRTPTRRLTVALRRAVCSEGSVSSALTGQSGHVQEVHCPRHRRSC